MGLGVREGDWELLGGCCGGHWERPKALLGTGFGVTGCYWEGIGGPWRNWEGLGGVTGGNWEALVVTDGPSQYLLEQTDVLVVGALGLQGTGKSTLLSLLAANQPDEDPRYWEHWEGLRGTGRAPGGTGRELGAAGKGMGETGNNCEWSRR